MPISWRWRKKKCAGLNPGAVSAVTPSHYVGGDFRGTEDLEQAHVAYAFPGLSNRDPDYFVAQIYATALGGGTSSRLFQEAREKRGLCYSIYAFSTAFRIPASWESMPAPARARRAKSPPSSPAEMEAIAATLPKPKWRAPAPSLRSRC